MIIRLEPSPDTKISTETDADGNVTAVLFEPTFAARKGQATLCHGTNTSAKGKALDRFTLTASAATGVVKKTGRTSPVSAAADEADEPNA